jgi:NADPH:quinone reductase-like Zn-dependent oxidoreductase
MRVLEIQGAGGLDNLKFVERPDPRPGPGEVVVRMQALSLNYRDWITVSGLYGGPAKPPLVPLSDGAGVIEAAGAGVTRVKPGDKVSTLFFAENWMSGPPTREKLAALGGGTRDGCAVERLLISADGVSKYPDHLDAREASTLPCAALTAWRALAVDAQAKAGDVVVLQGTGGVSIFGLQFAKAMGLETIVTSSSEEKLARAKALGADHLVNYAATPEWSAAVRAATRGRGADVVLEVGGAKTLVESLKSIRLGGHVAVIGVLSGFAEPLPIPLLFSANARVQGLTVGSRENFEDMCRAIALHRIRPVIGETFPWEAARNAFETMAAGRHFGKIALGLEN